MKTKTKKINSKLPLKGIITASFYRQTNPAKRLYNKFLVRLEKLGIINRSTLFDLYQRGQLVRQQTDQNVICVPGINTLIDRLDGSATGDGEITQVALGDGVGTVNENDTALFNEVYRTNKSSTAKEPKQLIVLAFFAEDEIDGTFTEFGTFVDGVALWTHVNVNWIKPDTESLTVQCTYQINNA